MSLLTGLLPAKQGVAAYAALTRHADSMRAAGDARSRGQIMADTLVERVTGQTAADAVPVEVNLVMTDTALGGADPEPAELEGHGRLPAPLTRDWLRGHEPADRPGAPTRDDPVPGDAQVWLRQLYSGPGSGALVAMDSARRRFDGKLRRFAIVRDRVCRTPCCDAPIRHVDHPVGVAQQGPTNATNSQGLCEACNYTKEVVGWRTRLRADGAVETTTPTGHPYVTRPQPGVGRPPPMLPPTRGPTRVRSSRLEASFSDLVLAC